MELRQYLSLIRKWLWLIVLGGLLVAGTAFVSSLLSAPIYQSTVTLLINQGRDPVADPYNAILTSQRVATTYVEQLKSPVIAGQVIRDLDLPFNQNELVSKMTVQLIRDTQLIRISIEDTDPERAQAIANQVVKVFINFIASTQQARYQAAQKDLDTQVAEVRKKIDDTQKALAPLGDPSDPKSLTAPEFIRTERMRLQLELTTYQAQYAVLLKSQQDFRLAVSRSEDSITISAPPEVPQVPVRPNKAMNTLLGAVVGLLLSFGVAFLIEYLDDTVKTPEDVQRVMDLATMGTVVRFPTLEASQDEIVAINSSLAPYTEAYRSLRTNLQFSLLRESPVTLVVTSAEPGEGKTTTLANLGAVWAQMGKRVILVDTDLRRPKLGQLFGLPSEPGFTDLLLDKKQTIEALLRETKVPGLRILTSGKVPANPSEILASEWTTSLIESLKDQADVVLFDSPPVLAVTDAMLLANQTGNVLWVVMAGKTRTETLRKARSALAQVETKLLGVALNCVERGKGNGYNDYYYYSKDGQRGERRRKSEKPVGDKRRPIQSLVSGNGNNNKSTEASPEKLDQP